MSLTIDLPQEAEQQLRDEAARRGQTADQYAAAMLLERLASTAIPEKNRRAIEWLQEWQNREPDLEEAEGYPEVITPFTLREIQID